ncbi:BglG family transcription antiterminator LicT [Clostridium isatidis]|uniref:Transcription antiterminator LicT n=1 Tax=Clostridium isatidis TaxID=182773 RepID=A0A343JEA4_9CLOT|nr:PRD domain-containing protein [Clostridium isatidis]ASW43862.1 transcription antiterminator LicT [Clostridium isatidis]
MKIEKILNNNAVVIKENDNEKIVMGCGIAYKKRVGDEVSEDKIDKIFLLSNKEINNKFQELVSDIPMEYVELGEKIITFAKTQLGKKLNDTIYISLVDHIYTAITRFLEGIEVKNALLWEIKRFYKDEYPIGLTALDLIEEIFSVRLPEDEAGFIALHIVNAEMDGNEKEVKRVYKITKIMQEILNIVRYNFKISFDEDSVYYYRFISHLKFFADRVFSERTYKDENNDDLFGIIQNKYKNSFQCVEKIAKFIEDKYQYIISDEEKLYLTIHIERIVYKSNK